MKISGGRQARSFSCDERAHDQRRGAEERLEAARHAFGVADRPGDHVDRDDQIDVVEDVERDRVGDPAIDHDAAADPDRLEQHRHRRRGGERRKQRPFREHDLPAGIVVGRDRAQRDAELGKVLGESGRA